jgi:hypothetical protein
MVFTRPPRSSFSWRRGSAALLRTSWWGLLLLLLIETIDLTARCPTRFLPFSQSEEPPCWVCGFTILAEFLYLRPALCDLTYVIVDDRPPGTPATPFPSGSDLFLPNGRLLGVCPDYEAAFRLGVGYLLHGGCNELRISYTGFWSQQDQRVSVPPHAGLWITYGDPRFTSLRLNGPEVILGVPDVEIGLELPLAFAREHVRIEHNMVDAFFSEVAYARQYRRLRLFAGIRWADISVRKEADYEGIVSFAAVDELEQPIRVVANQKTHVYSKAYTCGIGPLIGTELQIDLCYGFSLEGSAEVSLLVGSASHQFVESDMRLALILAAMEIGSVDSDIDLREQLAWHLFPAADGCLGLQYRHCWRDWLGLRLEAGWQFVTFINALEQIQLTGAGGNLHKACASFNLNGFYLALHITV